MVENEGKKYDDKTLKKMSSCDSITVSSFAGVMGEISILTDTLEEAHELSAKIKKTFGRSFQELFWGEDPRLICVENGITDEEAMRM